MPRFWVTTRGGGGGEGEAFEQQCNSWKLALCVGVGVVSRGKSRGEQRKGVRLGVGVVARDSEQKS